MDSRKTKDLDNLLGEITKDMNNLKKEDLDSLHYTRSIPYDLQGRLDGEFFNASLYMLDDVKTNRAIRLAVIPGDYAMDEYMDIFRCTVIQESIIQSMGTSVTGASSYVATTAINVEVIKTPVWYKIQSPGQYLLDQFKELIALLAKANEAHRGRFNAELSEEAKRADRPDDDKIKDFEGIEVS